MNVIKVKPWGEGQGDHVVINACDFNPEIHKHLDEKEESQKPKRRAKRSQEVDLNDDNG